MESRNEIQKNYKKYLNDIDEKVKEYKKFLKTTDDIYAESMKLIDRTLDDEEVDDEIINISIEALKILLEEINEEGGLEEGDDEKQIFYPETGDKNFGNRIYHKKEFNQYKIPKKEGDSQQLETLMNDKCSKGVKTSETQKLLKNFISPYTPYKSLLIYHGVGVGKTCASLMIAENYKKMIQEKGKKIFIILPPSIQDNYKRQIIDISKVSKSAKDIVKQCTGDTYMTDKFIKTIKSKKNKDGSYDMEEIQRLADKEIRKNYEMMGYEKFVNVINKIENDEKRKNPETKKNKGKELKRLRNSLINKKIKEKFSDSLIIIDEAHNITMKDESTSKSSKSKSVSSITNKRMKNSLKKTKRFIRGGNRDNEFNNIANNASNDFWSSDSSSTNMMDNVKVLSDKEKFDFKIGKQFPPVIKKILRTAENTKLILLSATPMYNTAEEIVDLVNLLLINDGKTPMNVKKLFKNGFLTSEGKKIFISKISGYISYLRGESPVNFPQKLYPLPDYGLYNKNYPKYDINGDKLTGKIKFIKFIECEMTGLQWEVYQKYFDTRIDEGNYFDTIGLQVCNLVCGDKLDIKKEQINFVGDYFGNSGFQNIITIDNKKTGLKLEFKNELVKENFTLDKIHNISIKLKKIIEGLEKSNGICFVYSQFLWSGIYPLAISLELLGYSNYSGSNLLPNSYKIPKKKMNVKDENGNIKERKMKYLIIRGGASEDFDKYKKVDELNNSDGSLLKIVLGTKAAGEGLNILNVREVHVMEPWFHLNRIEQVIGRGIRNCSHKDLKKELRNVSVFHYCITEPKTDERPIRETLDMKLYRQAEEKIGKIGKVMEIVKKSAIDCHLNREGNFYLGDKWNKPIKMIDSRGSERMVTVEDKPFSNVCNYSDKCDFKCNNPVVDDSKVDITTYKLEFSSDNIKDCIEEIKLLFSNYEYNIVFTLKEIKKYLKKKISNIKEDIIFNSLELLVRDKIEISDYNGNPGNIIYRGSKSSSKYYIFQPSNITEEIPIILRKLRYDEKINKIRLEKLLSKESDAKKSIEDNNPLTTISKFIKHFEMEVRKSPIPNMAKVLIANIEANNLKLEGKAEDCIANLIMEKFFDYYRTKDRQTIINFIIQNLVREVLGDFKLIKSIEKLDFYSIKQINDNPIIKNIVEKMNLNTDYQRNIMGGLIRYIVINNLEYNRDNNSKFDKDIVGYSIAKENKIEFYSIIEGQIEEADKKLVRFFASYKDIKRVNMDNYNKVYGFCEMQSKTQKNLKFKIVEKIKEKGGKKTQEVTGSTCGPAYDLDGHIAILRDLDKSDTVIKLEKKNPKIGKKKDLCETLELILRMYNYIENDIFFLNYEDTLIWKNMY